MMTLQVCNFINIAYINIKGQTGLPLSKQLQIEHFIQINDIDILHCQEIDIQEDTFDECNYISACYNVISNNSQNKYGTATIVKNEFYVENIGFDSKGRIIIFDIENITFGNCYLPSGTDASARSSREKYFSEIIPNMLINTNDQAYNCLIYFYKRFQIKSGFTRSLSEPI